MKDEKSLGVFDKIKEDMFMEVLESAIPKIKPFLEPAMAKMNEYFGEDEKIMIIKKNKGQGARVFIFDMKKGTFEVTEKTFTADPEVVIGVYDIGEFATKMIGGEFTNKIDK